MGMISRHMKKHSQFSGELAALMGWKSEEDYVYDYKLTKKQISEIEKICSISLPQNLTLFLTCSDSRYLK
ncbi:hypothetical protein BJ917_4600 [Pseudomonas sp. WPR_5_2]|nr:hypothetical protein BJ917_4600 [Pseudomonas sp. WPR_5_2]